MARGDGEEIAWLNELVTQVRGWHDAVLDAGGGASGAHTARLFASCARPFQTGFGEELFPTDIDKAAALFHGIVSNHPFVDGNKRTATFAAILFLVSRHVIEEASSLQVRMVGELALETASTRVTVQEVTHWLHRIFDP